MSTPSESGWSPLLVFVLLFAGTLVLVPVAPFALLIFYALGAEDAFVTSFQWHVLVLVTSGSAVAAVVCALLDDTGGVRAVVRKPAGLVLLACWLVLVAVPGSRCPASAGIHLPARRRHGCWASPAWGRY
ncbi:MAG TPA: hypothetical protein VFT94_05070 [Gaiellaceae bacterium]|nr:hypothetical protein [Gaiellaceae bacterium]